MDRRLLGASDQGYGPALLLRYGVFPSQIPGKGIQWHSLAFEPTGLLACSDFWWWQVFSLKVICHFSPHLGCEASQPGVGTECKPATPDHPSRLLPSLWLRHVPTFLEYSFGLGVCSHAHIYSPCVYMQACPPMLACAGARG